MDSLPAVFDAVVARHPDRIALIDGDGRETTFDELQAHAEAFAGRCLTRGLGPGDRALVAMGVSADLYAALCGLWRIGAVAVFPEPAMGLDGLRHAARSTQPAAFVASSWYRLLGWVVPELMRLPTISPGSGTAKVVPRDPVTPDAHALISFTSGSTGAPKAIARSHGFMMAQYDALWPIMKGANDDRDLVGFPMMTLVNLAQGRTSILPNWPMRNPGGVDGRRLAMSIGRCEVTRALLPPALCQAMADAGAPPTLRAVFTGGGPVFPDVIDALAIGGRRVVALYGSTEAEPIACIEAAQIAEADREAMRAGEGLLAGHPVPGLELRLIADEIQVAGPHVNRGYLDPALDAGTKVHDAGRVWHRTGDAGRLDADGRLWLLGRTGAVIRREGQVFHPFAIEAAARYWPGVRAAALANVSGAPVLAIAGDEHHLPEWYHRARSIGIDDVRSVPSMPMDRRHASKIDARRLLAMLERGRG